MKNHIYVSGSWTTEDTVNAWTGGANYQYKFEINLFGWKIVFWKHYKN